MRLDEKSTFSTPGSRIELTNNLGVFRSNTDQHDIAKRVGGPKGAVILRHSNLIGWIKHEPESTWVWFVGLLAEFCFGLGLVISNRAP